MGSRCKRKAGLSERKVGERKAELSERKVGERKAGFYGRRPE